MNEITRKKIVKLPLWAQKLIGDLQARTEVVERDRRTAFEQQTATPVYWETGPHPNDSLKRYIPGAPDGEDVRKWPYGQYIKLNFIDKHGAEWQVGFDRDGDLLVTGTIRYYDYMIQCQSSNQMGLVSLDKRK